MTTIRVVESLAGIAPVQWNALAGGNPFLQHAFLHALHETGCATDATGWTPCHVTAWQGDALVGAMPLYLKDHSWGEYVFDWSWARAYQEHGVDYYPKLLCAVPFTPVTGPRLLAADPALRRRLLREALALAPRLHASSLHVLFPEAPQAEELHGDGLMLRSSVQFHWHNAGYRDFDHFLAQMNHDKRKKIRQERRRLREAGVECEWRDGREARAEDWEFFVRCYNRTYRAHRSTPYLNLAFFERLARDMPESLMLVLARRAGRLVASALNVHDGRTLYGRYWGTTEFVSGLHFEVCYYQAIEFCIARGLARFEGGAQGEHKLARGLMPARTLSAHWLAHPQFAGAVGQFLRRETRGIGEYIDELAEHTPFKGVGDTQA